MDKGKHLSIAELLDAYRIFPRLFLFSWSAFTMAIGWYLVHWYTVQPASERGNEETVALIGIFTAALGFTKFIYDRYSSSSRDWNQQPSTSSTTITSTSTTP